MSLLRSLARKAVGFDPFPSSKRKAVQQSSIDSTIVTENIGPGGIISSKTSKTYSSGGGAGQVAGTIPAGGRMLGYHLNKHGYFTKGGGTSKWPAKIVYHPPGTVWVRNRHRHIGNTRALRRSFSRVRGFAHLAMRTISFVKRHRLKKKSR